MATLAVSVCLLARHGVAIEVVVVVGWAGAAAELRRALRGLNRGAAWATGLAVAALVAFIVSAAAWSLWRSREPLSSGAAASTDAVAALGAGQPDAAAARFAAAEASFRSARRWLGNPLVSLGLAVPVLHSNVAAARTVTASADRVAHVGRELAERLDGHLRLRNGAVSPSEIRALAEVLNGAARLLHTSDDRLRDANVPWVAPPLRDAMTKLEARLARQAPRADLAAEAARLTQALLGANGPRHYFLAFQNNAELRGSGGLIGNWGELVASGGVLHLGRFGRLQELIDGGKYPRQLHLPDEFLRRWAGFGVDQSWQQVNVSPDFPTTAKIISNLYPQSGGEPIDGVIAVDPQGLASLLAVTGPVTVPGWPQPLTAENVVDVTLRLAYEQFPVEVNRAAFLGDISRAVWQAFITLDAPTPVALAAFTGAARQRHLLTWFAASDEERLSHRLGIDGAIPPPLGDALMVVNQNLAANKADLYLQRRLRYAVSIDPAFHPARVSARLELTLENTAPGAGLPAGVIGPYDSRFDPGENRTYVTVYSPLALRRSLLDGAPIPVASDRDLGRLAYSVVVSIPPLQSRTLTLDLEGRLAIGTGGWYRLDISHQPLVVADDVQVSVLVPAGWRIAEAKGASRAAPQEAVGDFRQDGDRTLFVRVSSA